MNTLFDKIWDAHVVTTVEDGPTQLYIDRLYCHEVTSPQAFAGLRERGIKCFRPEKIYCRYFDEECERFWVDSLRHDGQKKRYYPRSRSRTWINFAWNDYCLR
mgnify:CR=1 FL=1